MFVVADMGSTKTDWSFVEDNKKMTLIKSQGFNPHFYSSEEIKALLEPIFADKKELLNRVRQLYFYGSGCSNEEKINVVRTALITFFPNAAIYITHDLMGSARAVCGRERGIACILGTGANTCLYDGEKIIDNVPSLGFLLGDEGSGADLGRELIKYYMYGELPLHLEEKFEENYKVSKQTLVGEIYSTKHLNAYCGNYAKFLTENKEEPIVQQLVDERFREFFKRHVSKYDDYQNLQVHFIGSIAYYFSKNLRKAAQACGTKVGRIIPAPMEKLIEYHSA
ncbi:MAG: hypothetical protein ACKOXB_10580 [Flavobacteriales bacterium]